MRLFRTPSRFQRRTRMYGAVASVLSYSILYSAVQLRYCDCILLVNEFDAIQTDPLGFRSPSFSAAQPSPLVSSSVNERRTSFNQLPEVTMAYPTTYANATTTPVESQASFASNILNDSREPALGPTNTAGNNSNEQSIQNLIDALKSVELIGLFAIQQRQQQLLHGRESRQLSFDPETIKMLLPLALPLVSKLLGGGGNSDEAATDSLDFSGLRNSLMGNGASAAPPGLTRNSLTGIAGGQPPLQIPGIAEMLNGLTSTSGGSGAARYQQQVPFVLQQREQAAMAQQQRQQSLPYAEGGGNNVDGLVTGTGGLDGLQSNSDYMNRQLLLASNSGNPQLTQLYGRDANNGARRRRNPATAVAAAGSSLRPTVFGGTDNNGNNSDILVRLRRREPACYVDGYSGICVSPPLEGICRLYSYSVKSGGCIMFDTLTKGACCYKLPEASPTSSPNSPPNDAAAHALPSNLVGVVANPEIQKLLRERAQQSSPANDGPAEPTTNEQHQIRAMNKLSNFGGGIASMLADAQSEVPKAGAVSSAAAAANGGVETLQSLMNALSNSNSNGLTMQQKRNQLSSLLGGVAQTASDTSAAPDVFSGMLASLGGKNGGGGGADGSYPLGSLLSSPAMGGIVSQLMSKGKAGGGGGSDALTSLMSSPALMGMIGQIASSQNGGAGGGLGGMLGGLLGGNNNNKRNKKRKLATSPVDNRNPFGGLLGGEPAAGDGKSTEPDLSGLISGLTTAAQGDNASEMPLQALLAKFKNDAVTGVDKKSKKQQQQDFTDIAQLLKPSKRPKPAHHISHAESEADGDGASRSKTHNNKNSQFDPAMLTKMIGGVMNQIKDTTTRIDSNGGNSASLIKAFTASSGAKPADKQKLSLAMDALFSSNGQGQNKVMSMLTDMLGSRASAAQQRRKRQTSSGETEAVEERCTFQSFIGVCMANALKKLCESMEMNIAQQNVCGNPDEQFCCYSSAVQQPQQQQKSTKSQPTPSTSVSPSSTTSITINVQQQQHPMGSSANKPMTSTIVTSNNKKLANAAAVDGAVDDIINQLFSNPGAFSATLLDNATAKTTTSAPLAVMTTAAALTTAVTDASEVEIVVSATTPVATTATSASASSKKHHRVKARGGDAQQQQAVFAAPKPKAKPKPKSGGGLLGGLFGGLGGGGGGGLGSILSNPQTLGMIQQFLPLIMSTMGGDPKVAQQFAQFIPMIGNGGATSENANGIMSSLMAQAVGGAAGGGGGGAASPLAALMPMLTGAMAAKGGGASGNADPTAALMGLLGSMGKPAGGGGGEDTGLASIKGLLGGLGGPGAAAGSGGGGNLASMLGALTGSGSERMPSAAYAPRLPARPMFSEAQVVENDSGRQRPLTDISHLGSARPSNDGRNSGGLMASSSENAVSIALSSSAKQCGGQGESGMCVAESHAAQCQRVGYEVRASGCPAPRICCYQNNDVAANFKLENAESCTVNSFQGMCVPEQQAQQCPQFNLEVATYGCARAGLHCCYTRNVQKGVCGSPGRGASGQPGDTTVPEAPRLSTNIDYIEPGEFCWHAALLERYTGYYFCGAALIDPQWIITAAHCVQDRAPSEITVRLGEWDFNLTSEVPGPRDYAVHNMYFHSNFNPRTLENDLVLLKLAQPVDMTLPNICVACRPSPVDFTHKICVAAGWGRGDGRGAADYSPRLKRIPARVWPDSECEAQLRTAPGLGPTFKLPPGSFLCASAVGGQRVCRGDGGGALVCNIGGFYQMAGIVVSGFGCKTNHKFPALFVDLQQYQRWIDDVMKNNNIQKSLLN